METIKRRFLDKHLNVIPTYFDSEITSGDCEKDIFTTFQCIKNDYKDVILFENENSFTVLFKNVSIKYMQIIISID